MGIRKKIMRAFASLAILLLFAAMVSLFELQRLKTMSSLLDTSTRTMEVSKNMLDAVQDQNTALLQMIVTRDREIDTLFHKGAYNFDKALASATVTVGDRSELDSIYAARKRYNAVVADYWAHRYSNDWFLDVYKTSYHQLTLSIKRYMIASQSSLLIKAAEIEGNAHRAITPGVIALGAAVLIIVMFFFLLDLYFIKPVLNITKGLGNYLSNKVPFNVKVEGKDEVLKLRDLVDELINQHKSKQS